MRVNMLGVGVTRASPLNSSPEGDESVSGNQTRCKERRRAPVGAEAAARSRNIAPAMQCQAVMRPSHGLVQALLDAVPEYCNQDIC